MAKDFARRYKKKKKTRLSKLEEKRNLKQAGLFSFLSLVLVLALLIFGIPALIKLASWFAERKSTSSPLQKTDTLAPNVPKFAPVYEATNSARLPLTGFAEEESMVKIILNGEAVKEVTVDNKGEFKTTISLVEGENKIRAKAKDEQDNESDLSLETVVVYDTSPPVLEVNSPTDGDKYFDDDREITVKGKTDPDAAVYLNSRLITINTAGGFETSFELKEGENNLEFEAQDIAGNKSNLQLTVSYSD